MITRASSPGTSPQDIRLASNCIQTENSRELLLIEVI
jgi:hypothetical protein